MNSRGSRSLPLQTRETYGEGLQGGLAICDLDCRDLVPTYGR